MALDLPPSSHRATGLGLDRVVVPSIDTYLKYSEAVGQVTPISRPQPELTSAHQNVIAENGALRAELAASKAGTKAVRRVARRRIEG